MLKDVILHIRFFDGSDPFVFTGNAAACLAEYHRQNHLHNGLIPSTAFVTFLSCWCGTRVYNLPSISKFAVFEFVPGQPQTNKLTPWYSNPGNAIRKWEAIAAEATP